MDTVSLDRVTKYFGDLAAVKDLSLSVPSGSIYGFIGPNGSGKTTTLRMIMNILYPDSGVIQVLGQSRLGSCNDRIGYLPEERGMYKKMKVKDLLLFYGELKNGQDLENEVSRWLHRFDLADYANLKVETLSKGMSQKVQFIATVVAKPDLIILDEPFSGLDPVNTEVVKDSILDLQKEGATIIFSTHDMTVAERMCDFICMIFKGRKVLDGTLASIQEEFGSDTIRIRSENGAGALEGIPGISRVNHYGQVQELRVEPGTDPQLVLSRILERQRLTSFEIAKPSLHDIFVRIAGPDAREEGDA